MGMTYEQYWEQDCTLVKYYRKAAQIRQDLKNQDAWLQGAYFYEALVDVAPAFRSMGAKKPAPYRKEPFVIGEGSASTSTTKPKETVQEEQDNKARAAMEAFAIANNKKFKEKGGGVNG